jgi:hypothetical protein
VLKADKFVLVLANLKIGQELGTVAKPEMPLVYPSNISDAVGGYLPV